MEQKNNSKAMRVWKEKGKKARILPSIRAEKRILLLILHVDHVIIVVRVLEVVKVIVAIVVIVVTGAVIAIEVDHTKETTIVR